MLRVTDMKNGVIAAPVTRGVAGPNGVITAASASVAEGRWQAASIRGSVPLVARGGINLSTIIARGLRVVVAIGSCRMADSRSGSIAAALTETQLCPILAFPQSSRLREDIGAGARSEPG